MFALDCIGTESPQLCIFMPPLVGHPVQPVAALSMVLLTPVTSAFDYS
jgi:hypothetical protein